MGKKCAHKIPLSSEPIVKCVLCGKSFKQTKKEREQNRRLFNGLKEAAKNPFAILTKIMAQNKEDTEK